MNIAFVSTEKRINGFEKYSSNHIHYLIKDSLNDLSSEFMASSSIECLVVANFSKITSEFVLLLRQFKCLYPRIRLVLIHADIQANELFQSISDIQLLAIPEEISSDQILNKLRIYLNNFASDSRLPILSYRNLSLDPNTKQVLLDGETVPLKKTEFNLLELFMTYPNRTFTKKELLRIVWNHHYETNSHTVEVHITKLRQKLRAKNPQKYFETVHGLGYRLI